MLTRLKDYLQAIAGLPKTSPARRNSSVASQAGSAGESLAARWLHAERGFKIIARNWRSPHDARLEIDLIARDGEVLVFIEVKTRAATAAVSGYHAVDGRKRRALRKACDAYLRGIVPGLRPKTFRFDVVEIGWAGASVMSAPTVRHFENVRLFSKFYRPS